MLAYSNDDIVIMEETREEIFQITNGLLKANKSMGLCINDEKTKYIVM